MILFFISSPPWLKERKTKKIPLSRRLPSCELVSAAAADGKFSSLPLKTGSLLSQSPLIPVRVICPITQNHMVH